MVSVTQFADGNYESSTTSFTITIEKADPVISAPDITKLFTDSDFSISLASKQYRFIYLFYFYPLGLYL